MTTERMQREETAKPLFTNNQSCRRRKNLMIVNFSLCSFLLFFFFWFLMLRSKKQKTGCTGLVESWREDLARRLTQCTSKMIRQLADMCQQAREREKRSREDEEQEEDEEEEEDERTEDVCRRRWLSTSFCAEMRKPLLRQSPIYQQRRGRGGREGRRHIISIKHTEGGGLKMATGGKKEKKNADRK